MDNDKPFKTIEVIDSRTNQTCKIACMSCIRGHRTTACGIPVCRQKIFWTVKRPGRPSNSCTCRYGATGGCKCVVAKAACPHKPKKGEKREKRSGECRCDEQGRYCCLLEPQHWDMLLALQKPTVEFFPRREALEARHAVPDPMSLPMTPTFSGNSPGTFSASSVSSTPAPPDASQHMQTVPSHFTGVQSPTRAIAPRFGRMGLGAPQGSEQVITPNVLSWDGQAPETPREYHPSQYQPVRQPEDRLCCQGPNSPAPAPQYVHYVPPSPMPGLPQQATFMPFPGSSILPSITVPEPPQQPTQAGLNNYDKFNLDYYNYQFPSAICQTCGLNGCTCRDCPPVMQNSHNGSWAQCCGRKHARTATYVAPVASHAYLQQPAEPQHFVQAPPPQTFQHQPVFQDAPSFPDEPFQQRVVDLQSPHSMPDLLPFDPGDDDFTIPTGGLPTNLDLSDLLMSDLDRPSSGCCCRDP